MLTEPTRGSGRPQATDHGRDAGTGDTGDHGLAVAQRWRQDDAIQAVFDQVPRLFFGMLAGFALFDEELDVVEAGLAEQADQEFAEVGGARVTVQEADADRLGAGQVARLLVGGVVQACDRLGDLAARALAHQALAVHDARHRHRRHAGQLRDISHGRLAAALHVFLDGLDFGFTHVWRPPLLTLSEPVVCAILAHWQERQHSYQGFLKP
jgi:hypothetical protein